MRPRVTPEPGREVRRCDAGTPESELSALPASSCCNRCLDAHLMTEGTEERLELNWDRDAEGAGEKSLPGLLDAVAANVSQKGQWCVI